MRTRASEREPKLAPGPGPDPEPEQGPKPGPAPQSEQEQEQEQEQQMQMQEQEHGAALLMALIVTLFVSALGGALVLLASTETRIAGAEEWRHEARGVAEVLLERVFQDLLQTPDWNLVLGAAAGATFQDSSSAPRAAGWNPRDLDLATLTLNVQRESDDSNRWGVDGPQWRLYAFGPADALPRCARAGNFYVVAWVADDPGEGDGNPAADRNETIQVRADAFGPLRTRAGVRATVRRKSGTLQLIAWSVVAPGE